MKTIQVKEMMVPLEEYASVSEEATLLEAVTALEEAQKNFAQDRYRHRAVLVFGDGDRVVGKLSQLDAIRGLEKNYSKMGDLQGISHTGFSPEFIRSLIDSYDLWQKPMNDICGQAVRVRVKDIMHTPTRGEFVEEGATLDEAIHQLVMGRHQSLLVTGEGGIVGILRLTDVFTKICEAMKACQATGLS